MWYTFLAQNYKTFFVLKSCLLCIIMCCLCCVYIYTLWHLKLSKILVFLRQAAPGFNQCVYENLLDSKLFIFRISAASKEEEEGPCAQNITRMQRYERENILDTSIRLQDLQQFLRFLIYFFSPSIFLVKSCFTVQKLWE